MLNKLKLFEELNINDGLSINGINLSLGALYIYKAFFSNDKNIFVLVNSNNDINDLYNELVGYDVEILTFPMDSIKLASADIISLEFLQERVDTIAKLTTTNKNYIVISSLEGAIHPILNKNIYEQNIISLKINSEISIDEIASYLSNNLYDSVTRVSQIGEYAKRGYVLDLFLEEYDNPVRIEFWGDTIESIRFFDIETQLTINAVDEISLYPNPDCNIDNNYSTIIDYVNGYNVIIDSNQIISRCNQLELDLSIEFNLYLNVIDKYVGKNIVNYELEEVVNFNSDLMLLERYILDKLKNKFLVIIAIDTKSQLDLLSNLNINYIDNIKDVNYKMVSVVLLHLHSSLCILDKKICIINSKSIFNKSIYNKKYRNKFKFSKRIKSIEELDCGDYVVHELHGIGIYDGIVAINNSGIVKDFLAIKYRDSDKVFVPIEHINLVQKYASSSDAVPKINKLGSVEWEKTKRKINGRMAEVASKLIEIYAAREKSVGFACKSDSVEQEIFENEFEFNLTPDQFQAITEIKLDMESKIPMDRLVCGDVGFGKTEVAFRAAFKAIDNKKQVAYLCPTTILSIQQYESALNRFSNTDVKIALVNRFTPKSRYDQILEELMYGEIDFVIGTHSLLNDKIAYFDLGLLLIDEEQRFGVVQKEKIKEIKQDVDILTLTATPIPRTLQMSLLGIRGLSLIETAPNNRFPIQTYVIHLDNEIIREAIVNEMSRNGQTFIINNVISRQSKLKSEIKKMLPNVKVEVVNGKMNREEIEDVFHRFSFHEFDVLIATTIVETGINIPNANTLIVLDADKFGVSQLYQIRGRVGRSNKVAYAYLMYNNSKTLSDDAKKRLDVIKNFTNLGSGFKIASRDLSIRGAGDILGAEQSGFIDTIGMEMYFKLLNSALKNEDEVVDNKLSVLQYSNHIPSTYVDNDTIKVEIHKKIQQIDDQTSLKKISDEISDKFGRMPKELVEYMNDTFFDKQLQNFGVIKVEDSKYTVMIYMLDNIDGKKLFSAVNSVNRNIRISTKNSKVILQLDKRRIDDWKNAVTMLIKEYNK